MQRVYSLFKIDSTIQEYFFISFVELIWSDELNKILNKNRETPIILIKIW